jgi:hypothetical protein
MARNSYPTLEARPHYCGTEALARILSVDPDTVRKHAVELGGVRIGRVWRFNLARLSEHNEETR